MFHLKERFSYPYLYLESEMRILQRCEIKALCFSLYIGTTELKNSCLTIKHLGKSRR